MVSRTRSLEAVSYYAYTACRYGGHSWLPVSFSDRVVKLFVPFRPTSNNQLLNKKLLSATNAKRSSQFTKNTPGPQATVTYFERSPTTVASTSRQRSSFSLKRRWETIMDFDDRVTAGGPACQLAEGQTVDSRARRGGRYGCNNWQ